MQKNVKLFFPKKKKFCRKIGDIASRRNSMIITKGLKEGPDIRSVYGLGRTPMANQGSQGYPRIYNGRSSRTGIPYTHLESETPRF